MDDGEVLTPGYYAFTSDGELYDWLNAYALPNPRAKDEIRQWIKVTGR